MTARDAPDSGVMGTDRDSPCTGQHTVLREKKAETAAPSIHNNGKNRLTTRPIRLRLNDCSACPAGIRRAGFLRVYGSFLFLFL